MASFPIFVDVERRVPLVVGGGELAHAKVRLLLKRARRVAVASDKVLPAIAELIAAGRVELLTPRPRASDIRGRPLVISATADDTEDRRVSRLAGRLGVPVNVPDRPELSTFALAAIVDRGTVTLAIATEGAAPVLATRLRASLEDDLHPRLGRLADITREYRPAVAAQLGHGAPRRAFWNEVFSGTAAEAILAGDEPRGRRLITQYLSATTATTSTAGRVILVGAGPGDPELLTVKAVRAIRAADVILHDGLMGADVLDYARREAEIISVAKAKGRHSRTQAEINALIVAFARQGKTVVRLKGGDPSIFGRAGEEVDTLRAAGIDVEVVPGITAATAVAASLQIPLTHRDISRSVTFLSGHAAGDGSPDFDQVDLAALANRGATLVVYMGLSTAPVLAARLQAAGWSPATPVVAVARASQAGERRIATTLDVLAADPDSPGPKGLGPTGLGPKGLGLTGPALLLIGEVAGLDAAGAVEVLHAAATTEPKTAQEFAQETTHV